MKILIIDVNCRFSSTGKIVYDLYKAINANGDKCIVCYGRGKKMNEPDIIKFSTNFEVFIHAFLTRISGLTAIYSPFATLKLIKIIKNFKPDVIHIHELHGYFINISSIIKFLKTNKLKTVWTFHCEFMYTGKCGHAYECDKWKYGCGNCPNIYEYPKSLFFDFSRKMFNWKKESFDDYNDLYLVTPSDWLKKRVQESFLKRYPVEVIHNGIDTNEIFYPREYNHLKKRHNLKNEKIVLAVAPDLMDERKGGKFVNELALKFINENVIFIMIGVKRSKFKFADNVIALPKTLNQIELAEYYSMADVFVICSKRENFPTVCIESLACGTPVCGFDEGGTSETAPGKLGNFVKHGDMDSLYKAVSQMLDEKQISAECYKFAIENYSREKMYLKYMCLYKQIYESNGI